MREQEEDDIIRFKYESILPQRQKQWTKEQNNYFADQALQRELELIKLANEERRKLEEEQEQYYLEQL